MMNMNRRYKQKETKNQNYHDSIAEKFKKGQKDTKSIKGGKKNVSKC